MVFLGNTFRELHAVLEPEVALKCFQLEWVEKNDHEDHQIWRIGIMTYNDYMYLVILPVNEFGPDPEQWLEELSEPVTMKEP